MGRAVAHRAAHLPRQSNVAGQLGNGHCEWHTCIQRPGTYQLCKSWLSWRASGCSPIGFVALASPEQGAVCEKPKQPSPPMVSTPGPYCSRMMLLPSLTLAWLRSSHAPATGRYSSGEWWDGSCVYMACHERVQCCLASCFHAMLHHGSSCPAWPCICHAMPCHAMPSNQWHAHAALAGLQKSPHLAAAPLRPLHPWSMACCCWPGTN